MQVIHAGINVSKRDRRSETLYIQEPFQYKDAFSVKKMSWNQCRGPHESDLQN